MELTLENLITLFENNTDYKNSSSVDYAVNLLLEYLEEQPYDDDINYAKFIAECLLNNIKQFHNQEDFITDSFVTALDIIYSLKEDVK